MQSQKQFYNGCNIPFLTFHITENQNKYERTQRKTTELKSLMKLLKERKPKPNEQNELKKKKKKENLEMGAWKWRKEPKEGGGGR